MSAEPTEYDPADVLQFAGANDDRDTSNDVQPFQLADNPTVLVGVRPKMAILLDLVEVMYDDSDQVRQAIALREFIDLVLDEPSAKHLHERLHDPDDKFDLDAPGFSNMFQTLVGLWYQGPTGGPRASSSSRGRTGKRSTVRKRSRG